MHLHPVLLQGGQWTHGSSVQKIFKDFGETWGCPGKVGSSLQFSKAGFLGRADSGEDIAKDIVKQDRENEDYDYTLGGKL